MIRTKDLGASLNFYCNALGMKILRREEYPDGKFTLAFIGYGIESEAATIELTYNWEVNNYHLGDGYGHIAIEVDNTASTCDIVSALGYDVVRAAGPMKHDPSIVIALINDPDGYKIELIQRRSEYLATPKQDK